VVTVNKAAGNIETKRTFRNYQFHIEWRIPENITGGVLKVERVLSR